MAAPSSNFNRPHIALVPTPGLGHLIPLVQLATQLVHSHNFTFTLLLLPFHHTKIHSILQTLPDNIRVIFLPQVTTHDLPEDAMMEARISTSFTRSLPAIHSSIKELTRSTKVSAMVVDLCGTAAFGVAKEFDIPCYIFFTSNALVLSFLYNVRKLMDDVAQVEGEFKDMVEPIKLPGCVPVHGSDLIDSVQVRSSFLYRGTLELAESYNSAAGVIVNSCLELEPGAFEALNDLKLNKPPVYPVGPLVQTCSDVESDECLAWLDLQPSRSVLFVSFGSGGTLSQAQMNELALGLEASGVRFLWVVRSPNDKVSSGNYFSAEAAREDPSVFLSKGFLDRTKDVGLVASKWVPQVEILGHGSTGGFLSHCGWNSALEGIVQGVPLIAWPLYAEQRMNAALLTDGLGVAIRVRPGEDGLVRRGEVVKCVKGLFEGEEGKELRERVARVKSDVSEAGCSFRKSLSAVAQLWEGSGET